MTQDADDSSDDIRKEQQEMLQKQNALLESQRVDSQKRQIGLIKRMQSFQGGAADQLPNIDKIGSPPPQQSDLANALSAVIPPRAAQTPEELATSMFNLKRKLGM